MLALSTIASPRRVKILVGIGFVAIVAWPIVRFFPQQGSDQVVVAWVRWSVDVLRLGALAGLALVLRSPAIPSAAAERGPYRAAGEGAPAPAPSFSEDARARAASGLTMYAWGFVARTAASFASLLLLVVLEVFRARDVPFLALVGPIASFGTAIWMIVGLGRAGPLRPAGAARIVLGIGALLDALVIVFGATTLVSDVRPTQAWRHIGDALSLEWPLVAIDGAIALVLVTVALARAGRILDVRRVVVLARSVQSLVLAAGSFLVAAFFVLAFVERHRDNLALSTALFFGGVTLGSILAVAVVHVLLLRAAIRAVRG
jgi:hypothetical protein